MAKSTRYVTVWRLEDDKGVGIWHTNARDHAMDNLEARLGGWEAADRFNPSQHPGPSLEQYDFLDRGDKEHKVFGVITLSRARIWFHREFRRALAEVAPTVRLNRYRVPEAHAVVDNWQVVFDRREALLLETRKPDFDAPRARRSIPKSN